MKRITLVVAILTLAACGQKAAETPSVATPAPVVAAPASAPAAAPASAPAAAPAADAMKK